MAKPAAPFTLQKTPDFDDWLKSLDRFARAAVLVRIDRVGLGNLGDVKGLGKGLSELRIAHGPGYRVYFIVKGERELIFLSGGDKSSQKVDICRARKLVAQLA